MVDNHLSSQYSLGRYTNIILLFGKFLYNHSRLCFSAKKCDLTKKNETSGKMTNLMTYESFLKKTTKIARPIAASAAATVKVNIAKTCPEISPE